MKYVYKKTLDSSKSQRVLQHSNIQSSTAVEVVGMILSQLNVLPAYN